MADLMSLLQDADAASFEMERTKETMETAKVVYELAKESFEKAKNSLEQTLAQADRVGIPRPKMRKLVEERTQALMASGLMPSEDPRNLASGKKPKAAKPKAGKLKDKGHAVSEEGARAEPAH